MQYNEKYDFNFQEYAAQNFKGFPTFWQTLQLPSSGLLYWGGGEVVGKLLYGSCSAEKVKGEAVTGSKQRRRVLSKRE
jgi:hypothetical protein